MAYEYSRLTRVKSLANNQALFAYVSPDSLSTIEAAGYFNGAADKIADGDMLLVSGGEESNTYTVTSNNGSTVVISGAIPSLAGLAAGTVPVGLAADALRTGSKPRTIADKMGDVISAKDHYLPTDATFDLAINRAAAVASAAGGGTIFIPSGDYDIAANIAAVEGVTIKGDGMGATILTQTASAAIFFRSQSSLTDLRYFGIRDLTMVGQWNENQTLGGNTDRHVNINHIDVLHLLNIESLYCRQMAITAGYCHEIVIESCRIENCARDAINLTGSRNCRVISNTILHCNDDAIAVHTPEAIGALANWGQTIIGNHIEDSYGIKVLGAVKCIVQENRTFRVKGYSFKCDDEATSNEGYGDISDLLVNGNIFCDHVDPGLFGSAEGQNAVYIGTRASGFLPPIVGGTPPTINKPENYLYQSNTNGNSRTGGNRIRITNNIIAQTLKNGAATDGVWTSGDTYTADARRTNAVGLVYKLTTAGGGTSTVQPVHTSGSNTGADGYVWLYVGPTNYAQWGFGTAFMNTGYIDPAIGTGHMLTGSGIVLNGPLNDIAIEGNTIYGWTNCVRLVSATSIPGKTPSTIKNNRFIRYKFGGLNNADSARFYWPVLVEDNLFDADPYFESDRRTNAGGNVDGTWQGSSTYPTAIQVSYHEGVVFQRNTLRNLYRDQYRIASDTNLVIGGNTYIGEPAQGKGIGTAQGPAPLSTFLHVESDPSSATYGQSLSPGLLYPAANPPVAGIYMVNQIVYNNPATASSSPQRFVTTTGCASAGAWASGVAYAAGVCRTGSNSHVYSVVTAGGGNTANEPTHTYGEATGADGYVWRHQAAAAAVLKTHSVLAA